MHNKIIFTNAHWRSRCKLLWIQQKHRRPGCLGWHQLIKIKKLYGYFTLYDYSEQEVTSIGDDDFTVGFMDVLNAGKSPIDEILKNNSIK
ncbi:MAG: hypothetical protein ABJA71_10725 [Ginsengibacter sp.]